MSYRRWARDTILSLDLLPDTQNCGLRMRRDVGNVFPATDFKGNRCYRSRHASRHAKPRWRENVPGISGACATRNFAYLVRGPYQSLSSLTWCSVTHWCQNEKHNFPWRPQIHSFRGQHGAHLGPTGPRWAPCWPHELCYLGLWTWTGCLTIIVE